MTQFETTCPNDHSVKFTLEMCGRTAQCPKCSARFEVPKLNDVREMLGDEIDEGLEAEFKEAERKLKEYAKARAAKKALLEREAAEKAEREAAEKAEREAAEKAEREAAEKAEREATEKAEREATEKAEREAAEKAESEEEMIVFLCPNGHELSAPASRAGRKGKCPDCGAKFIVPTPEMLAAAKAEAESQKKDENLQDTDQELSLDEENASSSSVPTPPAPPSLSKISLAKGNKEKVFLYPNLAIGENGGIDIGLDDVRQMIPEALKMDPMAKFFWTLWTSPKNAEDTPIGKDGESSTDTKIETENKTVSETGADFSTVSKSCRTMNNIIGDAVPSARCGKIEIQTADGKSYRPTRFYEDKSLSPIGFFEAVDGDGVSVTLVIRWENVVRIIVKD